MALPATDGFNGTDGQALTTYSANWSLNAGDFAIYTPGGETDLRPNGVSAECAARWNADVFGNDQYAQAVLTDLSSGGGIAVGLAVRCDTGGAASYYAYYTDTTISYISKSILGTVTQIGANRAVPAIGSVLRLEVIGTSITIYDDGVAMGITETDSALTSGSAGVSGFGSANFNRIDSWEGGNLSGGGGGPTTPVPGEDDGLMPYIVANEPLIVSIF